LQKNGIMITLKTLIFNSFQVNMYLLYDETKECIIVDASCVSKQEKAKLTTFISDNQLKPVQLVITHPHIDHVAGMKYICDYYKIPLTIHKEAVSLLKGMPNYANLFGFNEYENVEPSNWVTDEETIQFGHAEIKIIYTPGHADGSICLYAKEEGFVISGDVLFYESIGRSDLPTGNSNTLITNIKNKLLVLPENTIIYPGHGPSTTIGNEKRNNPYL